MSRQRSPYTLGFLDGLPFLLVIAPVGLLFGVVATEAGLDILQALAFSIVVIAGAAQFTAVALMQDQVPVLIVIATALAVNLRMAMYSAALTPFLGTAPLWQRALVAYLNVDQTYALASARYEDFPGWTVRQRVAYFLGAATPVCPMWYVFTVIGALIGAGLPDWLALDFAVPICFLAIIAPALKTLAHVAAAVTSVVLALALAVLPFRLGLLVAALAAMAVGAAVETWTARRAGRRAAA
ncbi:AzlC family ABC transporter permease [Wenxinia saemankumensis]|uniref:Predicted branched-chain amino acid permease (Azaleucine resistance) n=1 Tax=Wenxinia saemankumensis TaxID=1447782 RepID=A0A1M6E909_9RHOB|nr:AzlC family ABC transporter permease [Wenxinia saemankumensis]SHI81903.1 Predicted branched-chain amino acid permease (azaleucine resistance) [Wenxinia saemankumensis]